MDQKTNRMKYTKGYPPKLHLIRMHNFSKVNLESVPWHATHNINSIGLD